MALALGLGCTAIPDGPSGVSFGSGGPSPEEDDDAGTDTDRTTTGEATDTAESAVGSNSEGDTGSTTAPASASGSESDGGSSGESTSGDSGSTGEPGECVPGTMQDCYTGPNGTENVGECAAGIQNCGNASVWGLCVQEVLPGEETCNGLDDDCNGTEDDGDPGGGGACDTGLSGPCAAGIQACQAGELECVGDVLPDPSETCGDSIDNDCNGTVDDGCVCDPLMPAAECGANNHCVPTPSGDTLCQGPTGAGTQYSVCADPSECAPIYECVATPFASVYCMQWCASDFDCPGFFDSCIGLSPAVFVGAVEWGVCYDGLP